jgi:hypothetical protein
MRNRILAALAVVLLPAIAIAGFAAAGDSAVRVKSTGYSVSVSIVEEAGGQFFAKAIVRGEGDAVVAAPAVRAKAGAVAETESTGPGGKPRVTFSIDMSVDAPAAQYEVQIFEGDVRQAHHQAKVTLSH